MTACNLLMGDKLVDQRSCEIPNLLHPEEIFFCCFKLIKFLMLVPYILKLLKKIKATSLKLREVILYKGKKYLKLKNRSN